MLTWILDISLVILNQIFLIRFFIEKKNWKLKKSEFFKGKLMIKILYQNFCDVYGALPLRMVENYFGILEIIFMVCIKNSPFIFFILTAFIIGLGKIFMMLKFHKFYSKIVILEKTFSEILKFILFYIWFLSDKDYDFRISAKASNISIMLILALFFCKLFVSFIMFFQVKKLNKKIEDENQDPTMVIGKIYEINPVTNRVTMKRKKRKSINKEKNTNERKTNEKKTAVISAKDTNNKRKRGSLVRMRFRFKSKVMKKEMDSG